MSDGIIRLCREHDMELRQLGAHLVCPHGHTCDVDWYVKPAATRVGPSLPLPVIEEPIERKPKEKRMPTPKVENPHGTAARYWQKCRCQPCKTAVSAHVRAQKLKRLKAEGKPLPKPRNLKAKASLVRAEPPVSRQAKQPRRSKALVVGRSPAEWLGSPAGTALESKVLRLRVFLAEAEQAYLAHVQKLLPGLVLSR